MGGGGGHVATNLLIEEITVVLVQLIHQGWG
jgi:hypothetical protein